MKFLGLLLSYLATIVVSWVVPLLVVALSLPLLQFVFLLQPFVAAVVMVGLAGLFVWCSLRREATWQAVTWSLLWGVGAITAILGIFLWYSLIIECVLLMVLVIPGVVTRRWLSALRWLAIIEICLTLLFLWCQHYDIPMGMVVVAILLFIFASLVGLGALRPFEVRRLRRRVATIAFIGAVGLLLWHPVVIPTTGVVSTFFKTGAERISKNVSTSPVISWYTVWSLRSERRVLTEQAKTQALIQLKDTLVDYHKERLKKGISQIPSLPLAPREWEELSIPREVDP